MVLSKTHKKALTKIAKAGFSHIKVELEGDLNRGDRDDECNECYGNGNCDCTHCDCTGYIIEPLDNEHTRLTRYDVRSIDEEARTVELECPECYGEGSNECDDCGGTGRTRGDDWSTSECTNWLLDLIKARNPKLADSFTYFDVYDDGSVDTELTFTLPTERAHEVIEVIDAFNRMSAEINGELPDTNNAGMHISLLPDGNYHNVRSDMLNAKFMENFRLEMTKLLPAVYFNATHNEYTRDLQYRMPKVSSSDKYSAIFTHGDRCIEYRVFDCCYDKPEVFMDKIEVIAKSLDFYSNKKANLKYKRFDFFDTSSCKLEDFYRSTDNIRALDDTLKHLKPEKSTKRLKTERNFKLNMTGVITALREERKQARQGYERYIQDELENIRYRAQEIWDTYTNGGTGVTQESYLNMLHIISRFTDRHNSEIGSTKPFVPKNCQHLIKYLTKQKRPVGIREFVAYRTKKRGFATITV